MYEDIKRYLRVVGNLTTMYIWPEILVYVVARFQTGSKTRTEKRIRPCTHAMLRIFVYVTSLCRAQVHIRVSVQDHGVSQKFNVRRIRRVIA